MMTVYDLNGFPLLDVLANMQGRGLAPARQRHVGRRNGD